MTDMTTHRFAEVPPTRQSQGIKWLRLVMDSPGGSGAVFVFLYDDLQKPCKYDNWYENLEIALEAVEEDFGVAPGDWKSYSELEAEGIRMFEEG